MDPATTTASRYRYRFQGTTSQWMSGDELREAAQAGQFDETAEIQMSGKADWRLAKSIRALSFEVPQPIEEETDENPIPEAEDRLTRFGSIRELMAAFIREEIEIDYEEPGVFKQTNLCAISSDHFETIDADGVKRIFIPLHRIRSIVALDTGKQGRNYRENHILRVILV